MPSCLGSDSSPIPTIYKRLEPASKAILGLGTSFYERCADLPKVILGSLQAGYERCAALPKVILGPLQAGYERCAALSKVILGSLQAGIYRARAFVSDCYVKNCCMLPLSNEVNKPIPVKQIANFTDKVSLIDLKKKISSLKDQNYYLETTKIKDIKEVHYRLRKSDPPLSSVSDRKPFDKYLTACSSNQLSTQFELSLIHISEPTRPY